MRAIKARFDGKTIILPEEASRLEPGEVIVIFEPSMHDAREVETWLKAQEEKLAAVWNNEEDSVYDAL